MAAILVLGAKVPFTSGGQEALVKSLIRELKSRGHEADTIELPFSLPDRSSLLKQAALWRSLDLESFAGKGVDLVIATKFPSYFAKHSKKSLWLVHQHRPLYDLLGTAYSDFSDDPRDEAIRRFVSDGDEQVIRECAFVSGISENVVRRLDRYNGIKGVALYPPLPLGDRYRSKESEPYILSVGRLCGIKRIDMMLKALPIVHEHVKLKIVGQPDEPGILDYLTNETKKHHLTHRVEFLGRVDDEDLLDLYARAMMVYYAPHNEDYGYVTLEAFASGKPIVTAHDSGGVLEFCEHDVSGIVTDPSIDAIGHACNRLVEQGDLRRGMGLRGQELVERLGLRKGGWERVVDPLLSPLGEAARV